MGRRVREGARGNKGGRNRQGGDRQGSGRRGRVGAQARQEGTKNHPTRSVSQSKQTRREKGEGGGGMVADVIYV